MENLPKDPVMLMSVINTWLRDEYATLDQLCEDREIDREKLTDILSTAGFDYMPEINQFR